MKDCFFIAVQFKESFKRFKHPVKKEGVLMSEQEILKLLQDVGALIVDSHIVYTSGRHGATYVNKDGVYPYTDKISALCRMIAEQFANDGVEVVIAPALGGIILSQWVTHHLSEITGRQVLAVYAEKTADGKGFVIKRGYDKIIAGKKVLIVEDVMTTGGSVKKVIDATREFGGKVIGLGVLCNRGGIKPADVADPPKLFALLNVEMESWEADKCPLCAKGIPINTNVGKGREFLANQ